VTNELEISQAFRDFVVDRGKVRIDVWLAENLVNLSRSRVQKLIEDGQVYLNDRICTQKKEVLKQGDSIHVHIPAVVPSHIEAQDIPLDILYEDEFLVIINKPANFVVHPAPGHGDGTLVNALLAHCPDLQGIGGVERPGIVHRLDKDTTGAIVVAKTELVLNDLQAQIKAKTARREYLAVVYGSTHEDSGTIDLPIGRHPTQRKKMAVVPIEKGGKNAITHWQVKERLGNYSWLHFQLETGRTHQIRVHTTQMGHPIIGDQLYGSGHSVGVNLTGQALHAFRLTLTHPISGEEVSAIAPIPPEMEKLVKVLKNRRNNG